MKNRTYGLHGLSNVIKFYCIFSFSTRSRCAVNALFVCARRASCDFPVVSPLLRIIIRKFQLNVINYFLASLSAVLVGTLTHTSSHPLSIIRNCRMCVFYIANAAYPQRRIYWLWKSHQQIFSLRRCHCLKNCRTVRITVSQMNMSICEFVALSLTFFRFCFLRMRERERI